MNKYHSYIKEREGVEILENEYGFIAYKWLPGAIYICEHYVSPEFRMKGKGHELADAILGIAWKRGIHLAFCQCDEDSNGFEVARKNIENFGFEKYTTEGSLHKYKLEVLKWVER